MNKLWSFSRWWLTPEGIFIGFCVTVIVAYFLLITIGVSRWFAFVIGLVFGLRTVAILYTLSEEQR